MFNHMNIKKHIIVFSFAMFLFLVTIQPVGACSIQDLKDCDRQGLISLIRDLIKSRQMTDLDKFQATEIISNNLPYSIEFWTQADCSSARKWGYEVPDGYHEASCSNGNKGSHGGCPTCIMSKIKLDIFNSYCISNRAMWKTEYGFPNKYDSGENDYSEIVPKQVYHHLLSLPFRNSNKILRVYVSRDYYENKDCFVGEKIVVYNPESKASEVLMTMDSMSLGASAGGLFLPYQINKNDQIIFNSLTDGATRGNIGGYKIVSYADLTDVIIIPSDSAYFYDDFTKAVYLVDGTNSPQACMPGMHSNSQINYMDISNGKTEVFLAEENTSYEFERIDESNNILYFKSDKDSFVMNSPDCAWYKYSQQKSSTETESRSIKLP